MITQRWIVCWNGRRWIARTFNSCERRVDENHSVFRTETHPGIVKLRIALWTLPHKAYSNQVELTEEIGNLDRCILVRVGSVHRVFSD